MCDSTTHLTTLTSGTTSTRLYGHSTDTNSWYTTQGHLTGNWHHHTTSWGTYSTETNTHYTITQENRHTSQYTVPTVITHTGVPITYQTIVTGYPFDTAETNGTFKSFCTHSAPTTYDQNHGKFTTTPLGKQILTQISIPPPYKIGAGLGISSCPVCVIAIETFVDTLIAFFAAGGTLVDLYGDVKKKTWFAPAIAELLIGLDTTQFVEWCGELATLMGMSSANVAILEADLTTLINDIDNDNFGFDILYDEGNGLWYIGGLEVLIELFVYGAEYTCYTLDEKSQLVDRSLKIDSTNMGGIMSIINKNKSAADLLTELKVFKSSSIVGIGGGKNIITGKDITLQKFKSNALNTETSNISIFSSMRAIYLRNKRIDKKRIKKYPNEKTPGKRLIRNIFLRFNNKLKNHFGIDVSKYDVFNKDFYSNYYNNSESPNIMDIHACNVSAILHIFWDILETYALKVNYKIEVNFMVKFYEYLLNSISITNKNILLHNLKLSFPELQLSDNDVVLIVKILNYAYKQLLNSNSLHDILVVQNMVPFLDSNLSKLTMDSEGNINFDIKKLISFDKHKSLDKKISGVMKLRSGRSKIRLMSKSLMKKYKTQYQKQYISDIQDGNIVEKPVGIIANLKDENKALNRIKITNLVSQKNKLITPLKLYEYPNKIRLGDRHAGGYVIANEPTFPSPYDCYVGLGINANESFTRDFLNKYKIPKSNSYAYDGVNDFPFNKYPVNIQFVKKFFGLENNDKQITLKNIFDNYENIFMKINARGDEINLGRYKVYQLQKIKQLAIVLENFDYKHINTVDESKLYLLSLLQKTHQLIHVHAVNNFLNKFELTFVRKKDKKLMTLSQNAEPVNGLDFPSNPSLPEINLDNVAFIKTKKNTPKKNNKPGSN
jgi:hypothetical protein